MKRNNDIKINGYKRGVAPYLLFVLVLVFPFAASAQYYVSQQGRLLDANQRVGSFGLNTPARLDSLIPRANLYITGNMTGGASFQGPVPYSSFNSFSAPMGSSSLSNFRRDSIGVNNLSRGIARPRPFLDASRAVTRVYNGRVVNTSRLYRRGIVPVGASLYQKKKSYGYTLQLQPLSGSGLLDMTGRGGRALNRFNYHRINNSSPFVGINAQGYSPYAPPPFAGNNYPQPQNNNSNSPDQSTTIENTEGLTPNIGHSNNATDKNKSGYFTYNRPPSENQAQQQNGLANAASAPSGQSQHEQTNIGNLVNNADINMAAGQRNNASTNMAGNTNNLVNASGSDVVSGNINGYAVSSRTGTNYSRLAAKQYKNYMQKGKELLRQGKYYRAVEDFDSASGYIIDNPRNASMTWLAKSYSLFGAGEFMSAVYFLNKALSQTPAIASVILEDKGFHIKKTQLDTNMKELILWQKRTKQNALLLLQGYILYQQKQYAEAAKALSQAKKNAPKNRVILTLLKVVQKRLSDK